MRYFMGARARRRAEPAMRSPIPAIVSRQHPPPLADRSALCLVLAALALLFASAPVRR